MPCTYAVVCRAPTKTGMIRCCVLSIFLYGELPVFLLFFSTSWPMQIQFSTVDRIDRLNRDHRTRAKNMRKWGKPEDLDLDISTGVSRQVQVHISVLYVCRIPVLSWQLIK